ncbi:MAG: DNA mismatch repair endonuclease MutL [Clostridia bacterium]|nr:DNA mismatch repair endonuclease MutL [Clostridia bacterium]
MGKINVLGFDVANLIAAGEVVDRPSSVVKELLENAIDAGATKITVEIKNGGSSFIRISDDGCGMEHEDLPTAILRHATSKIKNADDLNEIMTLGFRGEALAAISSVSKVRIMSRQRGSEMGSLLEAHGGEIQSHIKSGCTEGTTVIVEDIFYNVPARKKFLKSDRAETSAVSAVVEKVALSRPDISFRYITDGGLKYLTQGDGNLQNAVYAVLGRDVAKKTVKVMRQDGGIKVQGYISTPEYASAYRTQENFYINSRFVKSKTAQAAIEQAYASYIPSGKFPFCVLNIIIDPSSVDVNVHPAKLEVKFSNEKLVFDAVYYAVRTALDGGIQRPTLYDEPDNIVSGKGKELLQAPFPVTDRSEKTPKAEKIVFDTNSNFGILRQDNTINYSDLQPQKSNAPVSRPSNDYADEEAFSLSFPKKQEQKAEPIRVENHNENPKILGDVSDFDEKTDEKDGTTSPNDKIVPDYKIIGEAFNSYVILEMGDLMYLIDKHAAHERIIFEDLKKKLSLKAPSSQVLMLPVVAHLNNEELIALHQYGDEIKKTGFSYDIDEKAVYLHEIPSEIEVSGAQDAFSALVSRLAAKEGYGELTRYEHFEKALYQASCKAAIKAGRVYDHAHIKWICDRVLTLDNIKYCPHGRPIAFEITKHFLEKQFERIK